jgi:predicted permease
MGIDKQAKRRLDGLISDAAYASRSLRRAPGLLVAVVLTLAIGVGANAAVYSVVHSLLLQPPPYRAADRLVFLWAHMGAAGLPRAQLAGPEVIDFQLASTMLESIGAVRTTSAALTGDGDPEQVRVGRVTWNFFDVLGVHTAIGRTFVEDDGQPSPAPPAIATWPMFQRRFGGDRAALGKRVVLDGVPVSLVGVLPPGFRLEFLVSGLQGDLQIFQPAGVNLAEEHRLIRPYRVIARLRDGVTLDQAGHEVDSIRADLARRHSFYTDSDHRFFVAPLLAEITREVRPALMALLGAALVVLVAACVNVAGLLIARAAARRREIATLVALGADPRRLARQCFIEGLILAGAGALAGLITGFAALRLVVALRPPGLDRLEQVQIGTPIVLAIGVLAMVWGLVFTLAPLGELRRSDVAGALQNTSRITGRLRWRTRSGLVVTQIALGTVLIVCSGLLIRTIESLSRVDTGFDASARALTFRVAWPAGRYPGSLEVNAFSRDLETRLRGLPGVTSVGVINQVPFDDSPNYAGKYFMNEAAVRTGVARAADMRVVGPDTLRSLGVTLLEGRWFTDHDAPDGAPVVIVDNQLAARAWPGQSAVGRRLRVPLYLDRQVAAIWTTVVGVVRHVRHRELDIDGQEQVYVPFRQVLPASMAYMIWTATDPSRLTAEVRQVLASLDPLLPAYDSRPLETYVARAMATRSFTATLVSSFAVMALVLAGVGLAALVSYSVTSRRREFGVRMALGATPSRVRLRVLFEGLALVASGSAIGLLGAAAAARAIHALLFGVGAADYPSYAGAIVLLCLTGVAASWWPAHRASGVNPVEALRAD